MEVWRANLALRPAGPVDLINAIGRENFASVLLREVTNVAPVDFCSVYDLGPDIRPRLFLSASSKFDVGPDCFSRYSRCAEHPRTAPSIAPSCWPSVRARRSIICTTRNSRRPIGLRFTPATASRNVSRWSTGPTMGFMALNFYRYEQSSALLAHHIDAIESSSASLFACIHKHLEVTGRRSHLNSLQGAREALSGLCPHLTARELDTCSGLLLGHTYDGIAASMQVSLSTVKTYRARAFDKLGIHSRSALFAKLHRLDAGPISTLADR